MGITYKTCGFNWVKEIKKQTAGSWDLVTGPVPTRKYACLEQGASVKGVPFHFCRCDARIMEHSKKPEEIRERIVELCGNLPRIELL